MMIGIFFMLFTKIHSINNKPALVQITAGHRRENRTLSEPITTVFTDAYMRHSAPMS